MNVLYFDCYSGVAGDMILAALLDLGLDRDRWLKSLSGLEVRGFEVEFHRVVRQGLSAQRIEVKVGEGNVTYSEKKEYEYLRDRGNLDTVKEGDEQPVEMSMEFVYEFVRATSGEDVTPVDAIKGINDASEWVSSSSDLCEPYAVDILLKHCVPCGTDEDEDVLLPDFRWEQLDYDYEAATIAVSGQCNVSNATVTRSTDTEC